MDIAAATQLTPELADRVVEIAMPLIEVSATTIRDRAREGRVIWYQTPEAVEQYIMSHNLYHASKRSRERSAARNSSAGASH